MSARLLRKTLGSITEAATSSSAPAAAKTGPTDKDRSARFRLKREQLKVKKQLAQEANRVKQAQSLKQRNLSYFASTAKNSETSAELMSKVCIMSMWECMVCAYHAVAWLDCSLVHIGVSAPLHCSVMCVLLRSC